MLLLSDNSKLILSRKCILLGHIWFPFINCIIKLLCIQTLERYLGSSLDIHVHWLRTALSSDDLYAWMCRAIMYITTWKSYNLLRHKSHFYLIMELKHCAFSLESVHMFSSQPSSVHREIRQYENYSTSEIATSACIPIKYDYSVGFICSYLVQGINVDNQKTKLCCSSRSSQYQNLKGNNRE